MKTTVNFRRNLIAAVMMLSVFAFTACSAGDSNDVVTTTHTEVVKAQNTFSFKIMTYSKGQDISTQGDLAGATLYIFDQNNDFVKQMSVDKSVLLNLRTIEVTCPGSDRITVIALGGLNGNESVTSMNTANIISDLTVSLKQNNGIANLPSDIFYGQLTMNSNQTKSDVAVLNVERKVSSLEIVAAGIAAKYGTTDGDYYVKVKQTKSAINFKGEYVGENVEYVIPARVSASGAITTDEVVILPAENVVVELYRNDVKVFSVSQDKNGKNLSAVAGGKLYVQYNVSNYASLVRVTDFGRVISVVNVG